MEEPVTTDGSMRFEPNRAPEFKSIGEAASFSDKDVPHFVATVCNALMAAGCVHHLHLYDSTSVTMQYGAAAAAAGVVALATWACEELSFSLFGGVLVALALFLRTLTREPRTAQVRCVFTTWIGVGLALFVLLMVTVSASSRERLLRRKSRRAKKLE